MLFKLLRCGVIATVRSLKTLNTFKVLKEIKGLETFLNNLDF